MYNRESEDEMKERAKTILELPENHTGDEIAAARLSVLNRDMQRLSVSIERAAMETDTYTVVIKGAHEAMALMIEATTARLKAARGGGS